jgi:hypothetical protein
VIEIDGPLWFVGALFICGVHVLYLRSWRRERREYLAWRQNYDVQAQRRHEEFMRAMSDEDRRVEWNLDGSRVRGQA